MLSSMNGKTPCAQVLVSVGVCFVNLGIHVRFQGPQRGIQEGSPYIRATVVDEEAPLVRSDQREETADLQSLTPSRPPHRSFTGHYEHGTRT
jgi:hypothetical protein